MAYRSPLSCLECILEKFPFRWEHGEHIVNMAKVCRLKSMFRYAHVAHNEIYIHRDNVLNDMDVNRDYGNNSVLMKNIYIISECW